MKAENIGLCKLQYCSTVSIPPIPPWFFSIPDVDLGVHKEIKNKAKEVVVKDIVKRYLEMHIHLQMVPRIQRQDMLGQQYLFQTVGLNVKKE